MNKQKIAIIGSGVAGLSCAWLLSKAHEVTLFEAEPRFGGHSHTESFDGVAVDIGFIVFNEKTYPNLTALFRHLDITTDATEMSFSVSMDRGRVEYSGGSLTQMVGSPRNLVSRRHWSMLSDVSRFYRTAKKLSDDLGDDVSLGEFLQRHCFGRAFIERHLIPMAAAIWSCRPAYILDYPAKAFIHFFDNHQLLNLRTRDKWRTVRGGSHTYVQRLLQSPITRRCGDAVTGVARHLLFNTVYCRSGHVENFDQVVFATHADQALRLLQNPSAEEYAHLQPFRYSQNRVVVHRDANLMPKRKQHWASWNYVGNGTHHNCGVTYWMNSLQRIGTERQIFISLNPPCHPKAELIELAFDCTHPIFSGETLRAQKQLWHLQGQNRSWFCGAYFGAGFHEDGLQSGLAVAEQLGGVRRPWSVNNPSGRIYLETSGDIRIAVE